VAVEAGVGIIVTTTTAIWPLSPEKVLGCRAQWAAEQRDRLDALIRALYRAALWCEDPANHADLAHMLAAARYIGAPANLLQNAVGNKLSLSAGAPPVSIPDFFFMARHHATFPWVSHALWFYSQMLRWQQVEAAVGDLDVVKNTYRPDIYRRALAPLKLDLPTADTKVERFFDEGLFTP
jgi:NitT/TauT family transport system ATP-binding protein